MRISFVTIIASAFALVFAVLPTNAYAQLQDAEALTEAFFKDEVTITETASGLTITISDMKTKLEAFAEALRAKLPNGDTFTVKVTKTVKKNKDVEFGVLVAVGAKGKDDVADPNDATRVEPGEGKSITGGQNLIAVAIGGNGGNDTLGAKIGGKGGDAKVGAAATAKNMIGIAIAGKAGNGGRAKMGGEGGKATATSQANNLPVIAIGGRGGDSGPIGTTLVGGTGGDAVVVSEKFGDAFGFGGDGGKGGDVVTAGKIGSTGGTGGEVKGSIIAGNKTRTNVELFGGKGGKGGKGGPSDVPNSIAAGKGGTGGEGGKGTYQDFILRGQKSKKKPAQSKLTSGGGGGGDGGDGGTTGGATGANGTQGKFTINGQ